MRSKAKTEKSGWLKLGGKWPKRLRGAGAFQQTAYSKLYNAACTIVEYHDSRIGYVMARNNIAQRMLDARCWILNREDSDFPYVCRRLSFDPDVVRAWFLASKLL